MSLIKSSTYNTKSTAEIVAMVNALTAREKDSVRGHPAEPLVNLRM